MQGCGVAFLLSTMQSLSPLPAPVNQGRNRIWGRRLPVLGAARRRCAHFAAVRYQFGNSKLGSSSTGSRQSDRLTSSSWLCGNGSEKMEPLYVLVSRCEAKTGNRERSPVEESSKSDFMDGKEPLPFPVALLGVPLGLEAGAWITAELMSSYLWFKMALKHVVPLFMILENPSGVLEVSLDSSRGRVVLWEKRQKREARRRRFFGSEPEPAYEKKIAGYLPVMSSASSLWCPPTYQLLLPAPTSWSEDARSQLLAALDSLSHELDWYICRLKGRVRGPDWWEDMGDTYGVSLLVLIGMGYWVQGFRCFPWLGMNYYFKDGLQLDPLTLQFLQNTVNLPYLAKPVYGIISDAVYIHGAHRVPYIIIAGIVQVLSWGTIIAIPGARRSAGMLTAFLTFGNLGAAVADVANDALVAESGKRKGCSGGQLQSFAWLASAAGGLLGNFLSGLALSGMEFESMFMIFVLFLGCHLLIAFSVSEQSFGRKRPARDGAIVPTRATKMTNLVKRSKVRDLQMKAFRGNKDIIKSPTDDVIPSNQKEQAKSIDIYKQISVLFDLVKSPQILLPLLWFMSSYALIPTLSGSIFYYQSQALKINPFFLGLAKMLGQAGLLAGSMLYERYLKPVPLRKLVGCVQVLLAICMLADIALVNRMNLQVGIPDQFYILGASAFVEAIGQFKILPFMVFFAKLCPAGCEGSLLAFFMSCQCLACIISGYLGVALASFLDISASDFTHLGVGILVQSLAALLPLVGITLLPGDLEAELGTDETAVEKVA